MLLDNDQTSDVVGDRQVVFSAIYLDVAAGKEPFAFSRRPKLASGHRPNSNLVFRIGSVGLCDGSKPIWWRLLLGFRDLGGLGIARQIGVGSAALIR